MLELIAAVAAVVISIAYTEWRTRQGQGQQARAARRMLSLEVERNLELARELRARYDTFGSFVGREVNLNWARPVFDAGMPPWSQSVWQSHVNLLASTMGRDELMKLFEHHGHVNMMVAIYGVLRMYRELESAPRNRGDLHANADYTVQPLVKALDALLALGNPIGAELPTLFRRLKRHLNFST